MTTGRQRIEKWFFFSFLKMRVIEAHLYPKGKEPRDKQRLKTLRRDTRFWISEVFEEAAAVDGMWTSFLDMGRKQAKWLTWASLYKGVIDTWSCCFYSLHYLLGRRRGHNLFALSFTEALVCTILGKKLPVPIQRLG